MLSRSCRLTTHEFAFAFEKGRVMRHPLLQMRIYRREDFEELKTRAAFVVPKKLGKAVYRNRLRRKVRERYRVLPARPNLQNELQGCDVIFFINAGCESATSAQIDEGIAQLLKRGAKAVAPS